MKRFLLFVLICVGLVTTAVAQETRATLTGRVTDPTGAVVPNVTITILDTDTDAKTIVRSTANGDYTAPFLQPGNYKVSVQIAGFKGYVHTGLLLQTQQTVTENIVLQLGDVSESVTVSAATPLVDTANADTGQSLTQEEVQDLPNNGRSPLGYARMEYGVVAKGKHSIGSATPFDNSSVDDFSLGGGQAASNELLLNGVPNMEDNSRTAGFSPNLDAVDTVHVDEFSANAAMGDTNGGTVNITTKSGTNELHGSVQEYYAGSRPFQAKPYFTAAGANITSTHTNQFGGTLGGPVTIPHLIHGRDKLFFFYSYEGYRGKTPVVSTSTVPTADERNGDFHNLITVDGTAGKIYDPYTFNSTTGLRTAVPNNCFTGTTSYCQTNGYNTDTNLTLSPIAQAYLNRIPLPNYSGSSTTLDGQNNYIAFDPSVQNYDSHMARFDYNVSASDKMTFEVHRSYYDTPSANIYNNDMSGSETKRTLWGGQADNIKTFSPTLSLETRFGFSRSESIVGPTSLGENPSSVGFPGYLTTYSSELALPAMTTSDGFNMGSATITHGSYDVLQFYTVLNKNWGKHSLKVGADIRSNKNATNSASSDTGGFTFSSANAGPLTQSPTLTAYNTKQTFGGGLALFELGIPSSGSITIGQPFTYSNWYSAGFIQDDWKATHNLSLSVGIRIEHETPVVESNNKAMANWNAGLSNATTSTATTNYGNQYATDSTAIQTAATKAGYTSYANYLPNTSSFNAYGGTVYATSNNRSPYSTAPVYISPRLGFAYAPDRFHGTLAIRGGVGVYINPFSTTNAGYTYGYSQPTSMKVAGTSTNNYQPLTTIADPFPQSNSSATNYNPIIPLLGGSMGVNAQLGNSLSYYANAKVVYSEKFNLDVQKQLSHNWLAEVGGMYVYSLHNQNTTYPSYASWLPYLDHTASKNSTTAKAVGNAMAVAVANPFVNLMPSFTTTNGSTIANNQILNTSSTVSVYQLAQANPQYSSTFESMIPNGIARFEALNARLFKRMANGLEFDVNYEWSRQLGTTNGALNYGDKLWYGETSSDFPEHISVTTIYQLPFGHGRLLLHNAGRLVDETLGGWQVSGVYQYLSGTGLSWSKYNYNYSGTFHDFNNHPHETHKPSFNTSGFDTASADQPSTWNYRTFPLYLLRSDPTNNFDFSIQKDFLIWERVKLQPRVDAFNALNHAQMYPVSNTSSNMSPTGTNFGMITGQQNTNRQLEGGVHILF